MSTFVGHYNQLRQYLAYFMELKAEADARIEAFSQRRAACVEAKGSAGTLVRLSAVVGIALLSHHLAHLWCVCRRSWPTSVSSTSLARICKRTCATWSTQD